MTTKYTEREEIHSEIKMKRGKKQMLKKRHIS
jgi:hypothetical protein